MGRSAVFLAVVMLALVAIPAESGSTDLGTALHIDRTPDSLRLLEGATGTVRMNVRNLANVTMRVGFVYMVLKGIGATGGNITPDLIELMPGEVQRVQVRIRSYGGNLFDPNAPDGHLRVYWGPNLTRDATSWPHLKGWEDFDEVVIPVSTISNGVLYFVAIIVFVVAIVASVNHVMRRRGRPPAGPNHTPPCGL